MLGLTGQAAGKRAPAHHRRVRPLTAELLTELTTRLRLRSVLVAAEFVAEAG